MSVDKLSVSLPSELVSEIDDIAQIEGLTRSAVIREATVAYIAWLRSGVRRRFRTHRRSKEVNDSPIVGLDDSVAKSALDQCRHLGCSFYDALAPVIAERLGAKLYSSDTRAHARFPGIVLI